MGLFELFISVNCTLMEKKKKKKKKNGSLKWHLCLRDYSALCGLGFPLPALATMQEVGVTLSDACWDVRKSLTGFSVSFFWPATPTSKVGVAQGHSAKSKKRRRKRKRGRVKDSTEGVPAKPVAKQVATSPVVAHHNPDFVDTPSSSFPTQNLLKMSLLIVIWEEKTSRLEV